MFNFLAQADIATPQMIFNCLAGVALVLGIADRAKSIFGPKTVPQPLVTQPADEFVHRKSYETHCTLNRQAHEAIKTELAADIKGLQKDHNVLAGDVREMMGTLEANGVRLLQMDQKIDRLLERPSNKVS